MKASYPELEADYPRLSAYAFAEEETFLRTLAAGSATLDLSVAQTKDAGGTTIAGAEAFLLHDTYGFPIDLTLEIAEEAGLTVDRAAFDTLMLEQRARAKTDAKSRKRALADHSVYREFRAKGETVFTGYTDLETESTVLGVLVDGVSVDRATTGQIAEVILADTSLYAESGGQVADKGIIVGPGYELDVLDVQRPVAGLTSHTVEVTSGEVGVGQPATSVVDAVNRRAARQAHSATHLVHAALRDTLGKTATQAGSLNRAGYMRLDFTWGQALSPTTRDRDRGDREQRGARQPGGHHADRLARRGEVARCDGAVRREVRRNRADGRHRRPLVARAVRRHACRFERRDRSGQSGRRIVGGRLQPPRGGPRRAGRVPRSRRRARDRVAADHRR